MVLGGGWSVRGELGCLWDCGVVEVRGAAGIPVLQKHVVLVSCPPVGRAAALSALLSCHGLQSDS